MRGYVQLNQRRQKTDLRIDRFEARILPISDCSHGRSDATRAKNEAPTPNEVTRDELLAGDLPPLSDGVHQLVHLVDTNSLFLHIRVNWEGAQRKFGIF